MTIPSMPDESEEISAVLSGSLTYEDPEAEAEAEETHYKSKD
jgi:hypothetical protein